MQGKKRVVRRKDGDQWSVEDEAVYIIMLNF